MVRYSFIVVDFHHVSRRTYVETQSGKPSRYLDYVSEGKGRYEVEHIWADHPQNLLARSLHPQCCEHNPRFQHFLNESSLPFKAYAQFNKADLEERGALYRQIAERMWNPDDLLREVAA